MLRFTGGSFSSKSTSKGSSSTDGAERSGNAMKGGSSGRGGDSSICHSCFQSSVDSVQLNLECSHLLGEVSHLIPRNLSGLLTSVEHGARLYRRRRSNFERFEIVDKGAEDVKLNVRRTEQ